MSFSFLENSAVKQTADETLHIITYELGHVVEYYHKEKRYGNSAYYSHENQKKEVADLISMIRMYCEHRGWDFEKLKEYGEECYKDRQTDLSKHALKNQLKET